MNRIQQSKSALVALALLSACASKPVAEISPPASDESAAVIECAREDDRRQLEIAEKPTGCELTYVKSGKAEKILSTSVGPQACFTARQEIQANLLDAGFACR